MVPDRLRPLVASKWRILALLAVPILLIAGGVAMGVLGAPGVADMQNSFGDVDEEETVIETDLIISNPNPFGLTLQDLSVNYTVNMNQIEMAEGDVDGIALGTGNTSLALETTMRNEAIGEWWTSHIAADEVTELDVDMTIASGRLGQSVDHTHSTTVETDILAEFNSDEQRPINADSPLQDDPILYINETRAEWTEVTETGTSMDMEFLVYNPNLEPYLITQLGYEITMNDVPVGAGETDREHVIGGHSEEWIDLTTTIDATTLDDWWVTHLDEDTFGHQVSELRIDFRAIVELPGGERVEVDLEPLTYEEYIQTDFFDEGGDVGEVRTDPADDDARDDEDADDREADDGETADDDTDDADDTDDDEIVDDDDDADDPDDEDDGILDDDDDGIGV